ncbi:transglutaminase-like domain-containing protein [Arenimonas composti]|uniref:CEP76/DRC7 peptidase-like domain-containing protein n=1 Tax=Arenimonas composti TR7-09 = DSM 18010 TaxID=1121013 RepID=A0A091BIF5_9GAMM|nr:transglutaminase-like domain-containing protein [Arenimonas composti]KFN50564.1 hypothetical protein P873_05235 [Arenimonas composti TR7-09 = DSM 18010]
MNPRRSGGRFWLLLVGSGIGGLLLMLLLAVVLIGLQLVLRGGPPGDPVDLTRLGADGPGDDFSAPAATRRIELDDGTRIDEAQIARELDRAGQASTWASFTWLYRGDTVATIAPGLDRRHHFAQSFLVGYVPFTDVPAWVPLYALSQRKAYQYDHDLYDGAPEIWQTSREAFHYPAGDCEDHAIALADWLIGLGYEARVVIGQVDGGGHAWVVLFDGGRTYLLEATDKQQRRGQALPLAETLPNYQPEAMFDRENYWVNTGAKRTVDYRGSQWRLASRFVRGEAGEVIVVPGVEPEPPPGEKKLRRR